MRIALVEVFHARLKAPYALLVVPDLSALHFDGDPALFLVAVLRRSFARLLELLQLASVRLELPMLVAQAPGDHLTLHTPIGHEEDPLGVVA